MKSKRDCFERDAIELMRQIKTKECMRMIYDYIKYLLKREPSHEEGNTTAI